MKAEYKTEYKREEIIWQDSSAFSEVWIGKVNQPETDGCYCQSIGYIISEDDNLLRIAQGYTPTHLTGLFEIPMRAIIFRRAVRSGS